MTTPLLAARGLVKRFGALLATDTLDLAAMPGEIHAVIGPNGAGKTTLIGQLAGDLRPDAGTIHFAGRDITTLPVHRRAALGLARSFQITSILSSLSVLENVTLAVQAQIGHSFRFWRPVHTLGHLRQPALTALERVGLVARAETLAAHLSYGEQRQLEIAMALASTPQMLLLDEPTAGMGGEEAAQMVALPPHRVARCGLGLVPEGRQIFPNLSVRENLVATAANRQGLPQPWTLDQVYALFPLLAERQHHMGHRLSGGEQQMLAIGRALLTNPRLLILDEATEGLAPLLRTEIWRVLAHLKALGQSILLIDKHVAALTRLADRHYIIEKGRVAWSGTSAALRADPAVRQRYLGV